MPELATHVICIPWSVNDCEEQEGLDAIWRSRPRVWSTTAEEGDIWGVPRVIREVTRSLARRWTAVEDLFYWIQRSKKSWDYLTMLSVNKWLNSSEKKRRISLATRLTHSVPQYRLLQSIPQYCVQSNKCPHPLPPAQTIEPTPPQWHQNTNRASPAHPNWHR